MRRINRLQNKNRLKLCYGGSISFGDDNVPSLKAFKFPRAATDDNH